jgi:hypothetical protein
MPGWAGYRGEYTLSVLERRYNSSIELNMLCRSELNSSFSVFRNLSITEM